MKRDRKSWKSIFWNGRSCFQKRSVGARWQETGKIAGAITVVLFIIVFVGALAYADWVDGSIFSDGYSLKSLLTASKRTHQHEFPIQCSKGNLSQTCPRNYPTRYIPTNPDHPSSRSCPDYFKWIHEDLRPWRETGITRDMVERARRTAHFRLVILDGKVYVEKYRQAIQTRDMFTLWGILQLLRWYPGRLPDLELMFDCNDRPVVRSRDFKRPNAGPPPLFRYCKDDGTLDIVFPDWSFWGWAETNIKPWRSVLKDIKRGNKRTQWKDREPYAYWRGNPYTAPKRRDFIKCNVSDNDDWNTRIYTQDWDKESKQGFKQSRLEDQCNYRYKIYIEGWGWSVSEKYILACNSMTLLIRPQFFDFYIRGMVPLQDYWPVKDNDKCKSLKFAVEWGNNHTDKAEAIGEAGSRFIHEDLKMDYVYDYMFHLLNEYAKLLKFKPTIPAGAIELCSETLAGPAVGLWKKFMLESMVTSPTETSPCTIPPSFDPQSFRNFLDKKASSIRQVEMWENEYWHNVKMTK